eukprot:1228994-Pleurochrysis_carterae.AAC.1
MQKEARPQRFTASVDRLLLCSSCTSGSHTRKKYAATHLKLVNALGVSRSVTTPCFLCGGSRSLRCL